MGFQLICKTAFFIFVVATILVEETLTKRVTQDDDSMLLEWGIGILDTLTNDSCVDEVPFLDPDDEKWFYQCYLIDPLINGSFVIVHTPCDQGGYFDEASGTCFAYPPFVCGTEEGKFPEPSNCTQYNRCVNVSGTIRLYKYTCDAGSYFDGVNKTCVVGTCGTTPAPSSPAPSSTAMSTTAATTTVPTTTLPPFQCGTVEGTFPDPTNCTRYNRCIIIAGTMRLYTYTCPAGSYFDQGKNLCATGTCPTSPPPTSPPTGTTPITTASTTAAPSTTPTVPTTPPVSTTAGPFKCGTDEGTFPDPTDCKKYNRCIKIAGTMRLYNYSCPAGSYFVPATTLCAVGTC